MARFGGSSATTLPVIEDGSLQIVLARMVLTISGSLATLAGVLVAGAILRGALLLVGQHDLGLGRTRFVGHRTESSDQDVDPWTARPMRERGDARAKPPPFAALDVI